MHLALTFGHLVAFFFFFFLEVSVRACVLFCQKKMPLFGLAEWLGGGLSLEAFLEEDFRRRCVVVRGRGRSLKKVLGTYDVEELCETSASEAIHAWLKKGAEIESVEVEATAALKLHRFAGASLYFRLEEEREASLVGKFLRDTKLGLSGCFGGRGEVEVFVARKGHVTNFHFDFQENFTLQVRGSKKWTLRWPTDFEEPFHPLRARSHHFADTPGVAEDQAKAEAFYERRNRRHRQREIILRPGDCLYFPAGMEHRVEALDEPNLSMNVSLMAPTNADVVTGALKHLLLKRTEFRERVSRTTKFQPLIDTCLTDVLPTLRADFLAQEAQGNDKTIDVLNDDLPSIQLPAYFMKNALATLTPEKNKGKTRSLLLNILQGSNDALEASFRATLTMPESLCALLLDHLEKTDNTIPSKNAPGSCTPDHWRRLSTFLYAMRFFVDAGPPPHKS